MKLSRLLLVLGCFVVAWLVPVALVNADDDVEIPGLSAEAKARLDALFEKMPDYYSQRVKLEASVMGATKPDAKEEEKNAARAAIEAFTQQWGDFEAKAFGEIFAAETPERDYAAVQYAAQSAMVDGWVAETGVMLSDTTTFGMLYMASDLGHPELVVDALRHATAAADANSAQDDYPPIRLRIYLALTGDADAVKWLVEKCATGAAAGEMDVEPAYCLAMLGHDGALDAIRKQLEVEAKDGHMMVEVSVPLAVAAWKAKDPAPLRELIATMQKRFTFYPSDAEATPDDPETPQNEAMLYSAKYQASWEIYYTMEFLDLARRDALPVNPFLLDVVLPRGLVDMEAEAAFGQPEEETLLTLSEFQKWAEELK